MLVPMTSVQSGEMFECQKNKRIHEQKNEFYILKKTDEKILTNLSFSINDVKIIDCSRIDNKEWILLNFITCHNSHQEAGYLLSSLCVYEYR